MYTKYVRYEHVCDTPFNLVGDGMYAPGSLWECDYCGKEFMKMRSSVWQATVSVVTQ